LFGSRFVSEADKEWFRAKMVELVAENLGDNYRKTIEPDHVFVDFMR